MEGARMTDYKTRLIEGMKPGRTISFSDVQEALNTIALLEAELDRLRITAPVIPEAVQDE